MLGGLALMAGCAAQTSGTLYSGDQQQVAEAMENLNDTKTNKRFATAFAKGAIPADQRKYAMFDYGVAARPTVSGSTATAEVVLKKDGDQVGKQKWTLEKENEAWKIKSAPLP